MMMKNDRQVHLEKGKAKHCLLKISERFDYCLGIKFIMQGIEFSIVNFDRLRRIN